jgi:hypothetical protein
MRMRGSPVALEKMRGNGYSTRRNTMSGKMEMSKSFGVSENVGATFLGSNKREANYDHSWSGENNYGVSGLFPQTSVSS